MSFQRIRSIMSTTNEATSSKPTSSTVAKQIGLTVPIKEKTVKGYVNSLADSDSVECKPRQVQKKTVVAVAAAIEKVLAEVVGECIKSVEGTTFTLDNVTKPLRANDQFGFVIPFLDKGLEYVATHKKSKPTKKDENTNTENADNSGNEEESKDDFPFTFSCSNNIRKHVQDAFENSQVRVSGDAVQLVQYLLDAFYQRAVQGAYWIAQIHDRKTVQKNDIFVSFKILLPVALSSSVMNHVEEMTTKFEGIEDVKKENAKSKDNGEKRTKSPVKKVSSEAAVKPSSGKSEPAQASGKKADSKPKKVAKERAVAAAH